MDSVRSHLEILHANSQRQTNYVSWRFKLNLALKSKALYAVASGTEIKPAGADTEESVIAWTSKDIEAQTLVGLNVESNIATKIANCTSAYQMLKKLETLYGNKTEVTLEGMREQFFAFKYNDEQSVVENCMRIQQLAEDLTAQGDQIKESWIMTKTLSILPPKLHHFRSGWDGTPSTDKNLANLIERLQLEEDRLNQSAQAGESGGQSALLTKQKHKNQKPGQSSNKTNIECFKCGQKGHFKKDCKNKPCEKYLNYCKNKYPCNVCHETGHFAKNCPKKKDGNCQVKSGDDAYACISMNSSVPKHSMNDHDEKYTKVECKKHAYVTVGLSANNIKDIKSSNNHNSMWYQDCAATQHMTSHRNLFTNYTRLDTPTYIVIGDATEMKGIGTGDVYLEGYNGSEWKKIVLKNVLHVPGMPFNLFSVIKMLDKGHSQTATSNKSEFLNEEGKVVIMAERQGDLFKMKFRENQSCNTENCLVSTSIKIWHERLAHQNIRHTREILKQNNIDYIDDWNDYVCEACMYGKQHRISHPQDSKIAERTLDIIHVDLGEMDIRSLGGAKYFLLLKDDYSHFRTVYFLKTKDEAVAKLETFIRMVENQFDRRIKKFKSDNGTEIKNCDSKRIMDQLGIFHSKTSTYCPEQNGRIERDMRTVVEAARTIIHSPAFDADPKLWAEALNYAVFTLNQSGTSTVKGKTPAQLWFGRQMNLKDLKVFGCRCYVLIHKHKRGKIQKKSEPGMFVGYDLDSPDYRVFIPKKNDVVSSVNVIFDEKSSFDQSKVNVHTYLENIECNYACNDESDCETSEDESFETVESESESFEDDLRQLEDKLPATRVLRDRNKLKQPDRYGFVTASEENFAMIGETINLPIIQAMKDKNWRDAINEEYNSLCSMKTWKLVDPPKNAKPLTCKWILKEKDDGRKKARFVARGFEQKQDIDYSTTFSPVARYESIRLIFSIAASNNMKFGVFDVKTAFLNSKLKEDIYIYQPEGFDDGSGRVCKLLKSMYGLKQASKDWNSEFTNYLEQIGFTSTDDDPCIFYNEKKTAIIVIFVDDGCVIAENEDLVCNILKKLSEKFEITYNKMIKNKFKYLGMEVTLGNGKIHVGQPNYTKKVLEHFKLDSSNSASTPMEPGMMTNEENFCNDEPLDESVPYRRAIGALLYLSTISRPDISFAVSYLSRFNAKPMKRHWLMIRRIFQYLKGTVMYGISYDGSNILEAYTDSDYGGDVDTRRSTSGVLILRGGPVVWSSRRQEVVAKASSEAEYRAAVSSISELCWIRRVGKELGLKDMSEPTTLFVDNNSAIAMLRNARDGKLTKGKKHVEISRKFIQQHIGETMNPAEIDSHDQLADIFTKPLKRIDFLKIRNKIVKEGC